jgi:hypothetical protein
MPLPLGEGGVGRGEREGTHASVGWTLAVWMEYLVSVEALRTPAKQLEQPTGKLNERDRQTVVYCCRILLNIILFILVEFL